MRAWRAIISNPRCLQAPVAVFDVDGVLVDPSDRFRKALEEAGVTEEEFRRDARARKKVWEAFLSGKHLGLDRPVESAIKALRRRKREGVPVVIVTGRPENMAEATLKELERFGVPWDAAVFRSVGFPAKDSTFKLAAVKGLGLDVLEAHDDSPPVCSQYLRLARKGVYVWFGEGERAFAPPLAVFINGKRVPIDAAVPAPWKVAKLADPAGRYRLEYLGHGFEFAGAPEVLKAVGLIRREVLEAYGFRRIPLEQVLSTAGRRHTVAVIGGKEVRSATLYSINFDALFARIAQLARRREAGWEGSST